MYQVFLDTRADVCGGIRQFYENIMRPNPKLLEKV